MFLAKFLCCLSILASVNAAQHDQTPIQLSYVDKGPTLADLLTLETRTSIFYDYARELPLSSLFSDPAASLTVLAPVNKAVLSLPRKPHQDPQTIQMGAHMEELQYEAASKENVRRWVSAHIIPKSPLPLPRVSEKPLTYSTLLEDRSVAFSASDHPSHEPEWQGVKVDAAAIVECREAVNGILYVIDGTITVD